MIVFFFFFKQKTAYEMRISYWSSDVCSSDLILLYGTLSNLPKLFGGDGASVYTRGDTNVRLPVVNMPIASTAARIYNGVTTGWDALVNSTEGLTAQQGAEILSNMLGNRPIAGLIETFGAGGYDTDKSGQVVSKNVIEDQENFSYLNTAYRLMGIKSMQQQKDTRLNSSH